MARLLKIFMYLCIIIFLANLPIRADDKVKNPLEWLSDLEIGAFGVASPTGPLLERLNQLEESVTGRIREGTFVERLSRLDTLLYTNQAYDISSFFKLQALEWVLYKEGFSGPLGLRLEKMERLLLGNAYTGPFTKRLEKLVSQVFPEGVVKGYWANISAGLLVRVKIMDELSSTKSKPGDKFHFVVVETVTQDVFVLFPRGITGVGVLRQIKRPANLGRDARLTLDFVEIKTMDGSPVKIYYGSKAQEMNHSRQLAVGASAAGMLALGPQGILFGLAVKGRELTIPVGTEFYLQVKEPIRVFTLKE